jgi:hypothetical protein
LLFLLTWLVAIPVAVAACCCLQEKLGPQCMRWLEDQVASIREAATKTLQKIAEVRHSSKALALP